jgi:hypothetical protein
MTISPLPRAALRTREMIPPSERIMPLNSWVLRNGNRAADHDSSRRDPSEKTTCHR